MEQTIKDLVLAINNVNKIATKLDDKEYWINKAIKEAGFEPRENPWIHVGVSLWRIEISVYPDYNGSGKGAKYWINGEWFDTSFPDKYPFSSDLLEHHE